MAEGGGGFRPFRAKACAARGYFGGAEKRKGLCDDIHLDIGGVGGFFPGSDGC